MSLSRRSFLKGSVLAAGAVALGRLPTIPAAPVVAAPVAAVPVVTKMVAHVPVSNEALQDAPAMADYITRRLSTALAKMEDDRLLYGS